MKCRYTADKKYYLKTMLGSRGVLVVMTAGVLTAVLNIVLYVMYGSSTSLFLGIALAVLVAAYPLIMVNRLTEAQKQIGKGEIRQTVISFDDDCIRVDVGDTHVEYDYGQIRKIKNRTGAYLLCFTRSTALNVPKYGFETAEEKESFLSFIEQKINSAKETEQ